jgi:outer membrane protein insertion porin family
VRRQVWLYVILMLCSLAGKAFGQLTSEEEDMPVVREIAVKFVGPETVNRAVIDANIQTAVGKPFSRDKVEQDVRSLIRTGFFFDVRVFEEPVKDGIKVIFQVQGKATIKEIVFEGNKAFKTERLRRESGQKVGDNLDEEKAYLDTLKMVEVYQKGGYPDAKVESIVTIDRDTGKAVLKFKITEGPRLFIKEIAFDGIKAFKAAQLRKLIKTKKHWWGSWLSGSGVLKDEQFQEDLDTLRDFYREKGYIDMEIRGTKVERVEKKWIVVHITIFEGVQYKVGKLSIDGNKLFRTEVLQRRLKMQPGQTFTPGGMYKDIKAIEDYYGSRGYLDTLVRCERDPNVVTGRIDLTFVIKEGQLNYIELIEIHGNTKTKDKVIRRELAVLPGQVYDTVLIEKSVERLKNLNYFSKVDTAPDPTSVPNRKNLAITVEEQRTGSMTFGVGFSSVDSLLGYVELTQGNFDLFNWPNFTGGGQKLRVRAQLGLTRSDYILSYVEPWFLDQRLSFGFDLYNHAITYSSSEYTQTSLGGDVRLEKAVNQFTRLMVQYSLQHIDVKVDKKASQELLSQKGDYLRSGILASMVYDSRDSVFLTTRGNRTEFAAELAGGPFGGTVDDYKLDFKTSFYFPFFNKHVLQITAATGVVQAFGGTADKNKIVDEDPSPLVDLYQVDNVPIFDRYFLGGANNLRGFGYRKVGPKDVNNDPIGGNTYMNATIEYTFPIVERVRGALFFDIGNVWESSYQYRFNSICSDAGIGVRLNLPVGPVRLDYGYPLQSVDHAGNSGKIQFSMGYQF